MKVANRCRSDVAAWCRGAPIETPAGRALEEQRRELLQVVHTPMGAGPVPPPSGEPDELHAEHVRIHGQARADLARWSALLQLSDYLRRCEARRKDRAMLEALEALERAKVAEEGEARWLRVGCWIANRVEACYARASRRSKLVTRIDFSPEPPRASIVEVLEPTDIEEEEIKW